MWAGLRVTHYYHMHTSRGDVCLGVWGYGGMYAIIALSCHCREESLQGRRVALFFFLCLMRHPIQQGATQQSVD